MIDKSTFRSKSVMILFVVLTLFAFVYSAVHLWQIKTDIESGFVLDQNRALDSIKAEFDHTIEQLAVAFPAYINSSEFNKKVVTATLVGPYFVYLPQHYGEAIDHWDHVQLAQNQVWMLNFIIPVFKSLRLDSAVIYLIDPYDNLLRKSIAPLIELDSHAVSFFSFPVKGLFHKLHKFTRQREEPLTVDENYLERIKLDPLKSKTLYTAIGFQKTVLSYSSAPKIEESFFKGVNVKREKGALRLRKFLRISQSVYNWKEKTKKITPIAVVMAGRSVNRLFLEVAKKWENREFLLLQQSTILVSSLKGMTGTIDTGKNRHQTGKSVYRIHSKPYRNHHLNTNFDIAVLTDESIRAKSYAYFYQTAAITGGLSVLLLLSLLFYLAKTITLRVPSRSASTTSHQTVASNIKPAREDSSATREFFLIESEGKSLTIPLHAISHIKVTDHYCTLYYQQENRWKHWMAMERLKTFEERYPGFFIKINRSTLINPIRIRRSQLMQRKLIMEGEPENVFTISRSALDRMKRISHAPD